MLKYSGRFVLVGFYCFMFGTALTLIGQPNGPIKIYSTWDIVKFLISLAGIMLIGYVAGYEHGKKE